MHLQIIFSDGVQKENNMDEKTFKARTKKLAVAIIKQVDKLPRSLAADVIARQLIWSGTRGRDWRELPRGVPRKINA